MSILRLCPTPHSFRIGMCAHKGTTHTPVCDRRNLNRVELVLCMCAPSDLCVCAPAYPHTTLKRRWTTGQGEYDNDLPEHLHRALNDGQETSRIETTSSHQIVRCPAELAGNIPAMQTSIALRKPQSIFSSAAHLTQHFLTHSGFTCPQVLHTFRVSA
jgi:hypothetical protein